MHDGAHILHLHQPTLKCPGFALGVQLCAPSANGGARWRFLSAQPAPKHLCQLILLHQQRHIYPLTLCAA